MISFDTNLLRYSQNQDCSEYHDSRLALTLRHHGVTDFATRNGAHFAGFGFARVRNPLASSLA